MFRQTLAIRPGGWLVFLFSTGALLMDLRREKVDNGWVLTGILLFIGERLRERFFLTDQGPGFPEILASVFLPFLILFPFFCFRMIGAGDIKVFMTLGFLLTPSDMMLLLFRTFLIAAVIACVLTLYYRNLTERVFYLRNYIRENCMTGRKTPYYRPGKRRENIHMMVPFLLAVTGWCIR